MTDDDIRRLIDKIEEMPPETTHQEVMIEIAKAIGLIVPDAKQQ